MGPLKVFKLELPLTLAPTLNEYANMPSFKRAKLRTAVDGKVMEAKQRWRCWEMGVNRDISAKIVKGRIKTTTKVTGGRKRRVVLTRYSSRMPDELSCDVLGGKIPIDRLVQAGVLRDDNMQWIERDPHWETAKAGDGKVVLEVFEL